jgi:2-amino-4-hydroxy-6-hydroxymethyldihydropteridine diphosphokinase
MGPQDQPDYVNAVLEIETELSAHGLLDKLQEIERIHGRVRKRHWGERTLDLDLLLFGDVVIDDERLKVPHPGIAERAFVLYPLAEIAPEITIPKLGLVSTLKQQCPPAGLDKME